VSTTSPTSDHADADGGDGTVAVLVVHGGPGLADHTESYSGLVQILDHCATTCHAIIFYDQLGCGASDQPTATDNFNSLFSLSSYVDELRQVIHYLCQNNMEKHICLLGHSWGGQIVLEFLFAENGNNDTTVISSHVKGAIISNAPLDTETYEKKQQELREQLDASTRQFLEDDEMEQANDGSIGSLIYQTLVGISDTHIVGELKGWSVMRNHRLEQIRQPPCLFVTGKFDTVPYEDYDQIAKNPTKYGYHYVHVLEHGDHGPFFGPTAVEYFQAISSFFRQIIKNNSFC
jgi:pimeloyl-ACP methyl ester carboxylesterase